MATVVQSDYKIVTNTSPAAPVLPSSATAGNTIICVVGWAFANATTPLPTPTDANGTYQVIFDATQDSIGCGIGVFYEPNCAAGTHLSSIRSQITPPDGNFFATVALYEIAGLTSAPLDATSPGGNTVIGGSGQTSQATGSTGILAQASEFVLVAMEFDDNPGLTNQGVTVPAGFTVDPSIPSTFQDTLNNIGLQVGWKDVTSTAALNPSFTWPSDGGFTDSWAIAVTFKNLLPAVAIPGNPKRRARQGGNVMGLNVSEWF